MDQKARLAEVLEQTFGYVEQQGDAWVLFKLAADDPDG
jgi:hypothetical protein